MNQTIESRPEHNQREEDRQPRITWFEKLWVYVVPVFVLTALGWESTQTDHAGQSVSQEAAQGSAQEAVQVLHSNFLSVAHWFDPVYFQYNLIMAACAILMVPLFVSSYVITMADRKKRRLKRQTRLKRHHDEIDERMARRNCFSTYFKSVLAAMVVIALGVTIILLFKPAFSANESGVNFGMGANFLMMGPFIDLLAKNPEAFNAHLMISLTAFQFGFLGAYVYFYSLMIRAYFTLDLTSQTLVDGTVRMIVASIMSLVVSFYFHQDIISITTVGVAADSTVATAVAEKPVVQNATSHVPDKVLVENTGDVPVGTAAVQAEETPVPVTAPDQIPLPSHVTKDTDESNQSANNENTNNRKDVSRRNQTTPSGLWLLPVVSFFFGFYPKRALLAIERIVLIIMKNTAGNSYRALPLYMLSGMSYAHELRLEREGLDNIENLSHADPLDIAIRTCFSYGQAKQWIDESWIAVRLREDYPVFVQATGITTGEELKIFFASSGTTDAEKTEQLVMALSALSALSAETPKRMTQESWRMNMIALKALLDQGKHKSLQERESEANRVTPQPPYQSLATP